MHAPTLHFIVFLALIYISGGKTLDHRTLGLWKDGSSHDSSVSVLENALLAMTNLTVEQKVLQEQQHLYEKKARERNAKDEERQTVLSKALTEQQKLFKGAWGLFKRSMKTIIKDKNTNTGNSCPDPSNVPPKDCADLYFQGEDVSGIYNIWPSWERDKTGYLVYCDMETDGGGWTVIHRWGNYSFPQDYFRRMWNEYKKGFGDMNSAFWLGNEIIYLLTNQGPYQLRFDMDEFPDDKYLYDRFWIESESQNYKLHVEGFSINSTKLNTDNIFGRHHGLVFATFDKGNVNCNPNRYGWWYGNPPSCTLDTKLQLSFNPNLHSGDIFKKEMKIRPLYFENMKNIM